MDLHQNFGRNLTSNDVVIAKIFLLKSNMTINQINQDFMTKEWNPHCMDDFRKYLTPTMEYLTDKNEAKIH